MSVVAWAAFLLSLLALCLFLISNYKKLYKNTIQFILAPDLKIRLETGSTTSDNGEVTVGGPPDEFEREVLELQDNHENSPVEIPLSKLQHPDDHSEVDHFNISLINDDNRAYEGRLTIIADFILTNRHPDIPSNLHDISESFWQLEKRPASPGTMFDRETFGPKVRYEFGEMVLQDDGRSSSSWYINRDILTPESNGISKFEVQIEFEPRITPPNFPWWVPDFVGPIELMSIENTFVLRDDLSHS